MILGKYYPAYQSFLLILLFSYKLKPFHVVVCFWFPKGQILLPSLKAGTGFPNCKHSWKHFMLHDKLI